MPTIEEQVTALEQELIARQLKRTADIEQFNTRIDVLEQQLDDNSLDKDRRKLVLLEAAEQVAAMRREMAVMAAEELIYKQGFKYRIHQIRQQIAEQQQLDS